MESSHVLYDYLHQRIQPLRAIKDFTPLIPRHRFSQIVLQPSNKTHSHKLNYGAESRGTNLIALTYSTYSARLENL